MPLCLSLCLLPSFSNPLTAPSLPPPSLPLYLRRAVGNALCVLTIVISIYSIVAFQLFGDRDRMYFGSFSRSLFTMFQVLSTETQISQHVAAFYH